MRLDAWPVRLLALVAMLFALGCHSIPEGRSSVTEVQVRGADKVDEDDVTDKVATTESPKFLMLFPGFVYDYNLYDKNVVQRDLARVEAFYRTKGYYDAHARAGRIHQLDKDHVRVELVVEEGKPVLVKSVKLLGLEEQPAPIQTLAQRAANAELRVDRPFDQEQFEKATTAVRRTLSDRGFAYAKVTNDAIIDVYNHKVDVVLTTTVGPECTFGPVTIEGLGTLPDKQVRRALDIPVGKRYSEDVLDQAQQALLDLGIVASLTIKPELVEPPREDHVVPISVKLEPSRLRRWKIGGGFEFDTLKTDVHGLIGWQHLNFFGGLRSFSVTFRPGVVLYPVRVSKVVVPTSFLPEEKLQLEFRQPGVIEARTNFFIRPELSVQALLLNPDPPPDQDVLGYAEFRTAVGFDRSYKQLYAAISQNFQAAYPFPYVGKKDPTLGTLLISYPELATQFDFRDNRQHPRKGIWIGNTFQAAGGPFGGQAADIKIQPDVRGYIPIVKKLVVAMRASVGFLFPRSYGDAVENPDPSAAKSQARTRDYQLTFFRGFFSGGPNSNRGYPFRGISPYANVPFLSSAVATSQANGGCLNGVAHVAGNDCRSPTGGFSLWEASIEPRFTVKGPLSVAVFCDASDVSPHPASIRLTHPHLSCGAGGRYDTPVGPVRLDVGYRIPGMQVLDGLGAQDREPPDLLGIPIAVSFGIGEAF